MQVEEAVLLASRGGGGGGEPLVAEGGARGDQLVGRLVGWSNVRAAIKCI